MSFLEMLATVATTTGSRKRQISMLKPTVPRSQAGKGIKWTTNENKQLLNFLRNMRHYAPVTAKTKTPVIRWRMVTLSPNRYPLLIARMRTNKSGQTGKHLVKRVKYMKNRGMLPNNVKKALGLA